VTTYASEIEVPEIPDAGPWMSPLWVGTSTQVEESLLLGAPFHFGRVHLVPVLAESEVAHQDELTFAGFIVRPGVGDEGGPRLRATISLIRDGKRLGRPLDMPLESVEISEGLWVYMNGIALAGLPEPGTYGFAFEAVDTLGEVSAQREVILDVVD
jgi:hypothetical protein